MKPRYLITSFCLWLIGTLSTMAQTNTLSIPDVSAAPGKTISLPINIDNTTDIVAVQFTFDVPNSVELNTEAVTLSERVDGHSVSIKKIESQKYMVMLFSPSNKPILGRTGTLFTISLSASSEMIEGSEHVLTLSDVVLADKEGKNHITGFSAGKLTIVKQPDLEVFNVTTSTTDIIPGDNITLNWQVKNIGGLSTTSGWSEQIFLDSPNGVSKLLTKTYYEESLVPDGVVSRSVDVVTPQLLGIDGDATLRVKLVSNSDAGEPSWLYENNTASTLTSVNVGKVLEISPTRISVDEASAGTIKYYLTRSGNVTNAETFSLEATDDSRVSFPVEVVIEKGQSGSYFYAQVSANKTLDNDSIVNATITGNEYPVVGTTMVIEDDTYPALAITIEEQDVTEGGSFDLKISTERISSKDILINLSCDESSRFSIPSNIIIPAGEISVTTSVEAKDDAIPDVEHVVTFTASAVCHIPASNYIILLDNDVPTLQMELMPKAVSEAVGLMGVSAVLKRTDNIDKTVTVKFSDDSEGGIYYTRSSVEMSAGVEEITVNLGPIDNAIVDGERIYNISAAVYIASCSCNANNGTSGGVVTKPLTIYDNDGPTLSLSASSSTLKEGGEMSVTITRNTDTAYEQIVNLSSEQNAEIEYPATVTIPAGQSSATFTVKSKSNTSTSDGFTATITAEADGFAKGSVWFTVSDQTLPDAQITNVSLSITEAEVNSNATLTFTLYNSGSYELPELTEIGIYLANTSTLFATAYLQAPLMAGDSVVMNKEITLPTSVGEYNLYAMANDGHKVKELLYTNNTSSMLTVKIVSPFSTTVNVDKATYNKGEAITISGTIKGTDVAGKTVEVYIINSGYRHVINVVSAEDGTFQTSYTPYEGQMGYFAVGACYPGEKLTNEMASFNVYGIKRASNAAITNEILLNETKNGTFSILNPAQLDLTGVNIKVVSKPENCNIQIECPQSINANESVEVSYTLIANAVSPGNDWEKIELLIESNEGASLPITLYYYCRNKTGELRASIARINTTMIKDVTRDYPFTITNVGKGETGKISLALPSWMTSATPKEMASLEADASTTVILRFTPTEDMQLNVPVTGTIGINCENGQGLSLPFNIEPVSETTGTLTIDVCDEYTYYTAEAPHVAGAEVIVSHPTTGAEIAKGTTGTDGRFSVELPEGYYAVSVTAAKHNSYRNNILVDPGKENTVVVNLSYEAITIDWKMEEIEIEDEYEITTTVNYETNVPVPVVELMVPSKIEAKALPEGESLIFYATLTNKGLITAQDVEFLLPEGFTTLSFEALSHTEPFTLAPQQSVMIPVKVTKVLSTEQNSRSRQKPIDNDPCVGQPGTLYFWDCGLDRKWHRYKIALQLGSCNSKDSSTWDNSGNGGYGGSGGGTFYYGGGFLTSPIGGGTSPYFGSSSGQSEITRKEDKGCEPCQNKFMLTLIDCGAQLIPAYKVLKSVYGCIKSTVQFIQLLQNETPPTGTQIAGAALETISNCVAAKNAGSSDKNQNRAEERADAINSIVTSLGAFTGGWAKEGKVDWESTIDLLGSLSQSLVDLAGFDYDRIEELFCPLKLLEPCDLEGTPVASVSMRNTKSRNARMYPAYVQDLQNAVACGVLKEMSILGIQTHFYGDVSWLDAEPSQISVFFATFTSLLNGNDCFPKESVEILLKDKPENISVDMVYAFVERWNNTVNDEEYGNIMDIDEILECYQLISRVDSVICSKGYSDIDEYYEAEYLKATEKLKEASSSVCSSITLQFSQQMVMTRQAFRGTLTVFNGSEDTAMEDAKLTLEVKDETGKLATSHEFQINLESLTGFTGNMNLTDGWTLDAGQTGVATILFIPTKYAAPTVETKYSFGGLLSYIDPYTGLEVTRALSPVTLTVKPSPDLNLTYFMQRDILGDDPLTEVIEPSEEAEFSLLINNVGYGDATNVQMATQQPKIIENEKGLLIDFELISSQLNGGEKTLALGGSVATEFGDIPAKSQTYAQWWLKSSLLGHFTDYDVKATHVSSYGNPDLSLLNEVTIHELIRSLEITKADKTLVGFMTNDVVDANDTPDMLYLSDGETETVATTSNATIVKKSDTEYTLTVIPSAEGWNYGSITDPTYGISKLQAVVRQSDGKEISLRNFWQTDRTLRDGKDPLYENRIHFADDFTSVTPETYLLTFEPTPQLMLEVASVEGIPAENEIVTTPVETIKIMFNKPIQPETFTAEDITMAVQGAKQDLTQISISTTDNKTFTVNLSEVNKVCGNGYYVFTVQTAGITDNEGFSGQSGKTASWNMYRDGTVQLTTSVYPESAGSITRSNTDNVEFGSIINLTVVSSNGYDFVNWTVNGEEISTEPQLELAITNDMNVVANFKKRTYAVNIVSESDGGSVEGCYSGIYEYGKELTLNAIPNEDFVFTTWVVNGEPVGNLSTLSITVEKEMNISAIFTRENYQQTTALYKGWNWMSSYINEAVPVELFSENATRIVSQFDELIYDPTYGMVGDIDSIKSGIGYKIETPITFLKTFKGHLYNVEERPISLKRGWNWISYPYFENRTSAIITNAEEGDYIIAQDGFAEYADGYWEGTFNEFLPGAGYLYKSAADKELDFDFQEEVSATTRMNVMGHDVNATSTVDMYRYPNTMNIIGKLYVNNHEAENTSYRIYAMSGNEVRGVSQNINDRYYITIYGDEAVCISFIVEEINTGKTFIANETISFCSDVIGSRKAPYAITLGEATSIESLYGENRKMKVYNTLGILLHSDATVETIKSLSRGIYIIDNKKYIVK